MRNIGVFGVAARFMHESATRLSILHARGGVSCTNCGFPVETGGKRVALTSGLHRKGATYRSASSKRLISMQTVTIGLFVSSARPVCLRYGVAFLLTSVVIAL